MSRVAADLVRVIAERDALREQVARYERQLRYAAAPTMGLPGGVDPAEFALDGATELQVRLALATCIRGARAALHPTDGAS